MDEPHKRVVLFYKYFIDEESLISSSVVEDMKTFIHDICTTNLQHMKGRILLAREGINGTLSTVNQQSMDEFIQKMEGYKVQNTEIFREIDWKMSNVNETLAQRNRQPFPDLKISIVKEIVSTGNIIRLDDIPKYGGKHLSPQEFHQVLKDHSGDGDGAGAGDDVGGDDLKQRKQKELVVIDVRNTFEHAIGHFKYSKHKKAAMNPDMVTFSSFHHQFCTAENADYLKDKQVLMYCTGGIRCEKASAVLRKCGVEDVSQLSGGIHRYLEEYPEGFFQGRNFVFDQRVALDSGRGGEGGGEGPNGGVVGKCIECHDPYDEISGSRICTVCRDLVLVCPQCVNQLSENHCDRHVAWKSHYFTFLDVFDKDELLEQIKGLVEIRNGLEDQKNTRRTLMKQITKIEERIQDLDSEKFHTDRNAPRRCRTCREPRTVCDGLCWGFWKQTAQKKPDEASQESNCSSNRIPVKIGDKVRPGPDWNEVRFGKKDEVQVGTVIEIKSWNSGGELDDCVSVAWDSGKHGGSRNIYRWGNIKSGARKYDLALLSII